MKKSHIHSLDTLRGLAALAVCVFHSAPIFGYKALAPHAYLAVDFFFALSGLVLFTRYRNAIAHVPTDQSKSSVNNLWHFFIVRMARLYPLYLAATVAGLGYISLHLWVNHELFAKAFVLARAFLQSVFLIPNMDSLAIQENNTLFPFASQAWSVLWEVVASIAFFFWVKRGLKYSYLISFVAFFILFALSYPAQTIDGGWQGANIFTGFLRAVASFSGGIAIALALEAHQHKIVKAIGASNLALISYGAVLGAAIYIIAPIKPVFAIEVLMLVAVFPILILTSAISEPKLLTHPIGRWLGGISYALYLVHETIAQFTITVLNKMSHSIASPILGLVWLAALLGFSTLVWKFYEIPAQSWMRSKLIPANAPK